MAQNSDTEPEGPPFVLASERVNNVGRTQRAWHTHYTPSFPWTSDKLKALTPPNLRRLIIDYDATNCTDAIWKAGGVSSKVVVLMRLYKGWVRRNSNGTEEKANETRVPMQSMCV